MIESKLPGAPRLSEELAGRMEAALAQKGAAYVPRTHHLVEGKPKFINRLIFETSPYLLQHAHNPVNWYAWGEEAFAAARESGKPVFLSVGYSTCHWCHVMEVESFEDEEIARTMNERYICIKVDREERPDVDAVYMSAVQQLSGSGGWPMSVWLTSEHEPFYGGTYFPPRDGARGARRGFLGLMNDLADVYKQDRAGRIQKSATMLTEAVRENLSHKSAKRELPDERAIKISVDFFRSAFDGLHGGLRRAPKFPSNLPIRLLLRYARRASDQDALEMATLTLEKMAAGGIYDQLGGGFHRYSTDTRWLVPHFEKMLYDNAQLTVAYAEAYQVTKKPSFARVVRETLDYVLREMTAPEGGFYSATDADSEGEEGKFFVWSEAEIRAVVGAEADRFIKHYGVTKDGNFEHHNILCVARPDETEWAQLAGARQKLYDVRARRIAPLRDEKILSAWNGLMISGFAVGGRVLGEPRYVAAATRAADFVLTRMRKDGNKLLRSYKDGEARHLGFLDDYAFLAAGLLDLYEATFDARWLREALALTAVVEKDFADAEHGGWFMTSAGHEKLIAREKPNFDGAEPSGSSVALLNALRLGAITMDDRFRKSAERAFACFGETLSEKPLGLTEMLLALDFHTDRLREVVLTWPEGASPGALLDVLRTTFVPTHVFLGGSGAAFESLSPLAKGKQPIQGKATAYVCEQGACELPTADPAVLHEQLGRFKPMP